MDRVPDSLPVTLTTIDASAGTRFDAGYQDTAPRHGLGLLVSQEFGNGWQASLNYDYQSGMQWYRDEPIDRYHQLGARIAKAFRARFHPCCCRGHRRQLVGTHRVICRINPGIAPSSSVCPVDY